MAASDEKELDPNRALKRSIDMLNGSFKAVTKHLESLESILQQGYIEKQKEATKEQKIREAGQSVAQPKAAVDQPQLAHPGSLHAERSTAAEAVEEMKRKAALSPGGRIADQMFGAGQVHQTASQSGAEVGMDVMREHMAEKKAREEASMSTGTTKMIGGERVSERDVEMLRAEEMAQHDEDLTRKRMTGMEGWMNPKEMESIRDERMQIPEWKWRLDKKAQVSRDMLVKMSSRAGAKGNTRLAKALGAGGQLAHKVYQNAPWLETAKNAAKFLSSQNDKLGAMVEQGGGLGYNTGDAAGGRILPGGIPNPLAVFSSAGQESAGMKLASLENAIQGNLGFGDSAKISGALAEQGFANEGGAGLFHDVFGFKNRGQNQELTELYGEGKNQGLGEKQFLAMSMGTKFAGGSIEGLEKNIQGLGQAAKSAGMSTNMLAENMSAYAQMTAKQGTQTEQETVGKEISALTGQKAVTVGEANQAPLAVASAARFGVMPETIGATSAEFQTANAFESAKQALSMVPGGTANKKNFFGETVPTSTVNKMKVAQAAAWFHLPPNILREAQEHPGAVEELFINELPHHIDTMRHHSLRGGAATPEGQKEWGGLWQHVHKAGITAQQFQEDFAKGDKGGTKSYDLLKKQVGELGGKLETKNEEELKQVKIGFTQKGEELAKKLLNIEEKTEKKKSKGSGEGGKGANSRAASPGTKTEEQEQ